MFGRIEVDTAEEAQRLIELSQASKLMLFERRLELLPDKNTKPYSVPPEFMYERPVRNDAIIYCRGLADWQRSGTNQG